ncbi:MAG: diacylglycerol/polyprenol kinase family protein [Methanothrix sp.]
MLELAEDWRARLVREVRRKAIHISGLSVPFGLIFLSRTATAGAIALVLVISLLIEVQRLRGRIRLPEVREHEKTRVGSYIYYMAGSLLTVLLFPKTIAITAMLFLALGDTVSGLAGSILKNCDVRAAPAPAARCFCGLGWRIKPLPVLAATFAACAVIGALASSFTALPSPVYICGALGAAFADGVAVIVRGRSLDDNFSIPVLSGALMSGAALALGPLEKVF